MLAQQVEQLKTLMTEPGAAGVIAVVIGVVIVAVLVGLAIAIVICWFLHTCLARVPAQYRKQEPVMAWLLLIPCFNLVWNFFVYPKVAESYKAYFDSVGRTDVGDCGRSLAVTFCILTVVGIPLGMIPFIGAAIGCFLGLANLVIWILFMVKALTLKGQIPLDAGAAVPPAPPPSQP